jgi:phosphoesterase RecJ-like protein
VEVGAFLRQARDGSCKLSLRSKGRVDVQALASEFGGGGHAAAAGATLKLPWEDAQARVAAAVEKACSRLAAGR